MNKLTPDEHKILVDAIQDSATVVHKGRKDMNERIKELAEQAEKYADYNFKGEPFWSEAYDKKLAELIVLECYEHCKGQLLNSTLANEHKLSYNDGVADCAIGLLQHFGVEP